MIDDGHLPISTPSPTTVRSADGKIIEEFPTHSQAWYYILESKDKSLRIWEGSIMLYHQPSLIM